MDKEDALNDLNNIRQFLKERDLFDVPCKEGSRYSIGVIVNDFACHVEGLFGKGELQLQAEDDRLHREQREKEMRTAEFQSKYTQILPYRVTFVAWREDKDPDGIYESEHEPYEDHKGRFVELEVPHIDWVQDNWDTPLYELAESLTIDDLEESEVNL